LQIELHLYVSLNRLICSFLEMLQNQHCIQFTLMLGKRALKASITVEVGQYKGLIRYRIFQIKKLIYKIKRKMRKSVLRVNKQKEFVIIHKKTFNI